MCVGKACVMLIPTTTLSLALVARLRFIDFLLDHYGTFNRYALADYFAISAPQASHDIQRYIDCAPDNLHYDKSAKCYRRSATFTRVWP